MHKYALFNHKRLILGIFGGKLDATELLTELLSSLRNVRKSVGCTVNAVHCLVH